MVASLQAHVLVETNSLSHTEWLSYRRKGIGGSDIAAICGLSKWRKPIHIYLDKVGKAPVEEMSEAAEWGTLLEPLIAQKFADNHSEWAITKKPVIYSHPTYPWALGNLDRMVICPERGRGILEIKTASEYLRHEWDDGNIPDYYYVQLQWYFFITGLEWGYFATLIGGNKYREYEVFRNNELLEQLYRLARDFWENHILAQLAPPFDGSDATIHLVHRLFPHAELESVIEIEDAKDLLETYFYKKQQLSQVEGDLNELTNQLKVRMGTYARGKIGPYQLRWENRSRTSVDSKRLKEQFPDVYEECLKHTTYRQFSIKEKGE